MLADEARADVVAKSDIGFVVRSTAEVKASPAETWRALVNPATWWSGQHTFSGEAANLTLDPVAGGCFCEKLPVPAGAPKGQQPGSVQHLRVVYVEPGKAIRLSGALGPLQSEALIGTLTMTIKPTEAGTRILFEYVVGGFMRYNADEIGPAVDRVLAAQLASLAKRLGPVEAAAVQAGDGAGTVSGAATTLPERTAPSVEDTRASPGVGNRSGKVWSLPPSPGSKAVVPASAPVAKVVAPRPLPAKPVAVKPVPAAADAAPAKAALAKPAPVKAAPAKVAGAKPAAKLAAKPKAKPEDQDRRDGIDAFDQALGASNP